MFKLCFKFAVCLLAVAALAAAKPGIIAYSPYAAAYADAYSYPYAPAYSAYSAYSAYPYAASYIASPYSSAYIAHPYASAYWLRK